MEISKKALKIILASVVLVTLAVVITVIAVFAGRKSQDPELCNTDVCLQAADYLYSNLDESVNPCDDFYSFSCGGWKANNPRPEGIDAYNTMSILQIQQTLKLISILDNDDFYADQSLVIHNAQQFYRSCINIKSNDNENVESLKSLLKKIQFPTIESASIWNEDGYNLITAVVDASMLATDTFFDISVNPIDKENRIILVKGPEVTLGKLLLSADTPEDMKDTIIEAYRKTNEKRIKSLNYLVDGRDIESNFLEFIDFEKRLAQVVINANDKSDVSEEMTVEEMTQKFPDIDWISIFKTMFGTVNIDVNEKEKVSVFNANYFTKLGDFLKKSNPRVIANYVGQRVIAEFGVKTVYSFSGRELEIDMVYTATQKAICAELTDTFFGLPLSYYYVRHFFTKETLNELQNFLTGLRSSLNHTLVSNEWMDDETKNKAILKLDKMINYIAVPTWLTTENDLNVFYSSLAAIDTKNYVNAFQNVALWVRKILLRTLRDENIPDIADLILSGASQVNAFNSILENKIRIKMGILHRPWYYDNVPLAVNFGAIGYVLGHEILHGFDSQGSKYDEKGRLKVWWKNETREVYDQKVKCFVDQYSKYTEPGLSTPVNGTLTVDENIADNGGIYQSFNAYKTYAKLSEPEKDLKLPSKMSKYTREQLFFIAFANTYCGNDSVKYKTMAWATDVHASFSARVIVTLSNSEYFAKAFSCPLKSRMNPVDKCVLW